MKDNLKYFRSYVTSIGDKTFVQVPLTQVDMAIFALISYLPFENICKEKIIGNSICKLANQLYPYRNNHNIGFLYPVFDLLSLISSFDRYKNVCLLNFEYILNSNTEMQFSACTITIETNIGQDPIAIVSFRGTDVSVIGWKEDLSMAYIDETPSQYEAAKYLSTLPSNLSNFYLVGHSKGGYLAMHAAVSYEKSQKIQGVYCFDSPSIWGNPKKNSNWDEVCSKFHCFAPHQSLISLTLGNSPELSLIKSDSFSIFQHNPFFWHIKGAKFVESKCLSRQSLIFYKILQQIYNNSNQAELKLFTETIFKFIKWLGVDSVEDIVGQAFGRPIDSIKTISSFSDEEKQVLLKFLKLLVPKASNSKTY